MQRLLGELAAVLGLPCTQPDIPIKHITADSRQVQAGTLFVAYRGVRVDGHRFIDDAVARGARAVVGEQKLRLPVPYLQTPDARYALGLLSAAWEGWPSRHLGVIGVTGTDGKTTTCNLIDSILTAGGIPTGLLTTVNARVGRQVRSTGLHTTTPDAPALQRVLREMVEAESRLAVVETTSHGLGQWRVAGIDYDIAVVTNITHEHLDEHGSYAAYRAAKARLLELVAQSPAKPRVPKAIILNADDPSYGFLQERATETVLSYGIRQGEVRAESIQQSPSGLRFEMCWGERRRLSIETSLLGEFNVYNCLAAGAVGFVLGLGDEVIRQGLGKPRQIPGRMERIERGQPFTAIVDFAHTPYALRAALQTGRGLTEGRVIVVFGSAGRRDVEKRRLMGEVAGKLADLTIVTAEDPRTEDLQEIMGAIAEACRGVGGEVLTEPDRYRALSLALQQAEPGDVVMVCGKGHEQSMCFGEKEYPWDDRIALIHALDVYLGRTQSPPPFRLPTA
ncbi:MAG: UDP-N-acetylmuramoyl-L-alanyl-D-glutamate--2,6-diaminopimelate ligase [Chloroflexi bacterium]|nr:UDP-N-acetylmuramoyl-L-alanyl-D-glutamate--2,6-diaminopimelate ligase [Chloroflexota bacterium]